MKHLTWDISGMGGGYENQCQVMLWRGVEHLNTVKPSTEMWKKATQYENIGGVMITEGEELKALEAAIIHKGDDVTGGMHQAVMNHLCFIQKNGFEQWFEELKKHRTPELPYEWDDEDPSTAPRTDLADEIEGKMQ